MQTEEQSPPDDPGKGIPPEIKPALLRLWSSKQQFYLRIRPREAWIILALIQFADRNPSLSPSQHEMLHWFGGLLQDAIGGLEPQTKPYLEMGWDSRYDR